MIALHHLAARLGPADALDLGIAIGAWTMGMSITVVLAIAHGLDRLRERRRG